MFEKSWQIKTHGTRTKVLNNELEGVFRRWYPHFTLKLRDPRLPDALQTFRAWTIRLRWERLGIPPARPFAGNRRPGASADGLKLIGFKRHKGLCRRKRRVLFVLKAQAE
jgi:hypothetical protein